MMIHFGQTLAFGTARATPEPLEAERDAKAAWRIRGTWSLTFRILIDRDSINVAAVYKDRGIIRAFEDFRTFHGRDAIPEESDQIIARHEASWKGYLPTDIDDVYNHELRHVVAARAVVAYDTHGGQLRKLIDDAATRTFPDESVARGEANVWATSVTLRLRQLWNAGGSHDSYAVAAALGGVTGAALTALGVGIEPPAHTAVPGGQAPPPTGSTEAWELEKHQLALRGYHSLELP